MKHPLAVRTVSLQNSADLSTFQAALNLGIASSAARPGVHPSQSATSARRAHDSGPHFVRRWLSDRVVDVAPTSDGFDVAIYCREVRAHGDDGYVATASLAPRHDVVSHTVHTPAVLLSP